MCIILLFYIILCFSLFFPLMGAWLCHANIVQRVKSCYKIKNDSRVLDCCFYGVTLCKQHPYLTIVPLLQSNSGTIRVQKWRYCMIKVALLECKSGAMTLTDFTLHFSCCFTNLLHSHFVSLLNNFTMQEKCY